MVMAFQRPKVALTPSRRCFIRKERKVWWKPGLSDLSDLQACRPRHLIPCVDFSAPNKRKREKFKTFPLSL